LTRVVHFVIFLISERRFPLKPEEASEDWIPSSLGYLFPFPPPLFAVAKSSRSHLFPRQFSVLVPLVARVFSFQEKRRTAAQERFTLPFVFFLRILSRPRSAPQEVSDPPFMGPTQTLLMSLENFCHEVADLSQFFSVVRMRLSSDAIAAN